MWVEQTKTGYRLVERYTDPLTDKQKKVSVKLEKNTKQAINKARPILLKKIEDKLDDSILYDDITLEELIEEFKKIKFRGLSKKTILSYNLSFDKLLNYFSKDTKITKINTRLLNIMFSELSNKYKKGTLIVIKTKNKILFDYAVSVKMIKENPFKNVIIISNIEDKEKRKFLNKDEVIEVLELAYNKKSNYPLAELTEFLLFTGCRIGETLALTWDDYDSENKTISINKNTKNKQSIRTITLSDNIIKIFNKLNKTSDIIFDVNVDTYRKFLNKLNYKIHLHPHLFRHTHISMCAELGINIKAIMNRVGHVDSKTTLDIYTHVTQKMEKDLAGKLNNYF